MMIRLLNKKDLKNCHALITSSFLTVALALAMTEENCPNNSAYMKLETLYNMYHRGIELYGLYEEDLIGCVALEKKTPLRYNLKLLCVAPAFRNRSYGKQLIDFVEARVVKLGGQRIGLGMIDANKPLLHWYASLGYVGGKVKKNKANEYKITFMVKELK